MKWTIQEIANLLDGRIVGNNADSVTITHPCVIQEGSPGGITFLANQKYTPYIYTTKASVVLVKNNFKPQEKIDVILLLVNDPYISFTKLLTKFYETGRSEKVAIEFPSYIGDNVRIGHGIYRGAFSYIGHNVHIGDHVKIYPHVYIGDHVVIGAHTILYSGAKIYAHCTIGKYCIIHSGAVIGSDGFGFVPNLDGHYEKIPSLGNVILEDNVEIGANTTIDSATLKSTQIQQGVKIDNLVQLAHNVTIGKHTVIAAQTGIAGSTKIGAFCRIGGQAGIVGHMHISDHTTITAKSGISKSITQKHRILSGAPAFEKYWSSYAHFKNLPTIVERLEKVEKMVNK